MLKLRSARFSSGYYPRRSRAVAGWAARTIGGSAPRVRLAFASELSLRRKDVARKTYRHTNRDAQGRWSEEMASDWGLALQPSPPAVSALKPWLAEAVEEYRDRQPLKPTQTRAPSAQPQRAWYSGSESRLVIAAGRAQEHRRHQADGHTPTRLVQLVSSMPEDTSTGLFSGELVNLLALIDEQSPLRHWPTWAVALLRANKLSDVRELLILGTFMYANGVARPTIFAWVHARYKSSKLPGDCYAHGNPTSRQAKALLPSWTSKLQRYLDRVERRDPNLWTWSIKTG
eukprot:SAG31_NODE_3208_length_4552_cov_5.626993_5_plen_287_part_00